MLVKHGSGESQYEPIAIVGMACRLPGNVTSPSKLWNALYEQWDLRTKINPSRFNVDGFYNSASEKAETFNAREGFFLEQDIWSFDNEFFGINNLEAQHMDPQQRALLEVTFESLESAGIPLESISGKEVGCYVASFTYDHETFLARQPQHYHAYTATGTARAILANRLSYILDLKGPSVSIDTACSSSLYALHLACRALQNKECPSAIVAGANIIQSPDLYMKLAKAQMLSGSSFCHTFDESADGYVRGEGVGALYLKTLSDALAAGDPIRAIIRGTAINSNGRSQGLTLPSVAGQEAVIRQAFVSAGLPLNAVDYIEAHGTGTQVGDKIEVEAIAKTFQPSADRPLLIGSVKTNLGHGEGVSGINSIIKVAMCLENTAIVPTVGIKTLRPELSLQERHIEVVTANRTWPSSAFPRASINSFGFGGANGHVILEQAAITRASVPEITSRTTYLLALSAHSEEALSLKQEQIEKYSCTDPAGLEYTLGCRRSNLKYRSFAIMHKQSDTLLWKPAQHGTYTSQSSAFTFVFNGQGSQWSGMAKSLVHEFQSFKLTIDRLELHLRSLSHPPDWCLTDILTDDLDTTSIHKANIAQTASAALQIGLVNLLYSIGISPTITLGHSSGEIVAAYAAGFISEAQAIELAYYRGIAVSRCTESGTMAAVGLTSAEAEMELQSMGPCQKITIACINSPSNVTLSGPESDIDNFVSSATKRGIFARKLQTDGNAYHSPMMESCVDVYSQLLASVFTETPGIYSGNVDCTMVSSLFGRMVTRPEVTNASYWIQNLISPVRFKAALEAARQLHVEPIIEIGPHSSMRSAIKEVIAASNDRSLHYYSVLSRNHDSAKTFLTFVGDQYLIGNPNPLKRVTQLQVSQPTILTDLPVYPWSHEKILKPECGVDQEYLSRKHVRHELLGSLVLPDSGTNHKWENTLRVKNVPWLEDHCLSDTVVFPAAAYISMAIEAYQQINQSSPTARDSIHLENLQFRRFLALESGSRPVRVITEMKPQEIRLTADSESRYEFRISSLNEDGTQNTLHASGLISSLSTLTSVGSSTTISPIDENAGFSQPSRTWYRALNRGGLAFGPSFQRLDHILTHRTKALRQATANVHQYTDEAKVAASPYILHPTVIDAIFQLSIIALSAGSTENIKAKVPDSISSIIIRPAGGAASFESRAEAFLSGIHNAGAIAELVAMGQVLPVIEMRGFHMTAYKRSSRDDQEFMTREALLQVVWKPDITALKRRNTVVDPDGLKSLLPEYLNTFGRPTSAAKGMLLDLACHKSTTGIDVLVVGACSNLPTDPYRKLLRLSESSKRCNSLTFGLWSDKDGMKFWNDLDKHVAESDLKTASQTEPVLFDVIVVADDTRTMSNIVDNTRLLLKPAGQIFLTSISDSDSLAGFTDVSRLSLGLVSGNEELNIVQIKSSDVHEEAVIRKTALLPKQPCYLIYSDKNCLAHLTKILQSSSTDISPSFISFDEALALQIPAGAIIIFALEIYDTFFAQMTSRDLKILQNLCQTAAIVIWLQAAESFKGHSPDLSLAAGVGRTLMIEQPSLKFHILDIGNTQDKSNLPLIVESLEFVLKEARENPLADTEYSLHNGLLYISRFMPDDAGNVTFRAQYHKQPVDRRLADIGPARLRLDTPSNLSNLYFVSDKRKTILQNNEIEIEVKAFGLNAKDYYALRGVVDTPNESANIDFAGTVCRVGASVEGFKLGDRVAACSPNKFETFVVAPEWACVRLLPEEDSAVGASIPVVFATALYAIDHQAKAQPGESILIHSAAGGVGLAAIQLAKQRGLDIHATAGTVEKRDYLISHFGLQPSQVYNSRDESFFNAIMTNTEGRGIDVILNSLIGDLARRSWEICAQFGRFIDISKTDFVQGGKLPMGPFLRSATYHAFDLSDLCCTPNARYNKIFSQLLKDSFDLIREGTLAVVKPLEVFDISEVGDAFKRFADPMRYGKLAVSLENTNSCVKFVSGEYKAKFDATKAYLLIGCLGGLGRSLARYMVEGGARSIIFMSRSANRGSHPIVQDLEGLGANVQIARGDVTSEMDVFRVVNSIQQPIGGVVHAAMGLDEAIFLTQMTIEKWNNTIRPKLKGSWNLHRALKNKEESLDFFLLTSSVSGSVGTATESGYCAANAFLDAFAKYRNNQGSPNTISVGLGMISEVGYLHEHPEIEEMMLRKGVHPYTEIEMLNILDIAICSAMRKELHSSSHILTGLETQGIQRIMEQGFETKTTVFTDPRCAILAQRLTTQHTISDAKDNIKTQIETFKSGLHELETSTKDASQNEQHVKLLETGVTVVASMLANLLLLPAEQLHASQKLSNFTMDSMLAAEFRGSIFGTLHADVPFGLLLNASTDVRAIAQHIINEVSSKKKE